MAYHIIVEEMCKCAKARGIEQVESFDDLIEAEDNAYELAEKYNAQFCAEHAFDVQQIETNFLITVDKNGYVQSCEI